MARNTLQSREPGSGSCRWLIGLALVLIVFLGTTSCSKKDDSTNNEAASPETTETANASPSQSGGEPTTTPASGGEPNTNQPTGAIPKPTRPAISVLPIKPVVNFGGRWKNLDPNTKHLTRLVIKQKGDQLSVHIFVKCPQKDCDYGTHKGSISGNEGHVTFEIVGNKVKMLLKRQGDLLEATTDSFHKDGKLALHLDHVLKKQP